MSKFKVGDRVRRVDPSSSPEDFGVVGEEYVVKACRGDNINVIGVWWATARHFELIETSPVRTVTRKEIVPGVYGRIAIGDYVPSHMAGNVALQFADKMGYTGPAPVHWLSRSELTEAIATLTVIRDALDEVA